MSGQHKIEVPDKTRESRQGRNGTIEFWRIIFALMIVFCHGKSLSGGKLWFPSGAIGVEFFFLVSGFLMAKSVDRMPPLAGNTLGRDTLRFMGKKIKALCPNYFVAWFIAFVFYSVATGKTALIQLASTFVKSIYELLFLTLSGLMHMRVNGAVWYLHSMLLAMFILYPLLRKHTEFFIHVIAPLTAILLLGYMMKEYGNLRSPTDWVKWTYKGNIRAVAELCLGISLYPLAQKLKTLSLTKFSRALIAVVEHGGYVGLLICSAMPKATSYDFLFLLFAALSVMLSFSGQSLTLPLYQNKVSIWLGEFSLSLYLSHVFYAKYLEKLLPDWSTKRLVVLYFAAAFATALFVMYVSKGIKALAPKARKHLKRLLVV